MHYDKVFTNFIVEEVEKIDKEYHAEKIIIYTPEDLKEVFIEAFPKAYNDRLYIKIGNYIKTAFPKFFELLK